MEKYIELEEVEEKLNMFREIYDAVRLVDPVKKMVLELNDHKIEETCKLCYKYWRKGKICDNCISVRAYQEDKGYMKLEQGKEVCMLVTAIPVKNGGKPVVLELFKNATDVLMIGNGEYNTQKSVTSIMYEMNDLIIKDHLTEAFNRRFVDERLPADINWASTKNTSLSLIFIDLDNMKMINDSYGHKVGDKVLKQVVSDIQSDIVTTKDWVARYGGDEFVICLNGETKDKAKQIAQNIVKKIEEHKIKTKESEILISVSYGIYTIKDSVMNAQDLIHKADQEMYVMKKRMK